MKYKIPIDSLKKADIEPAVGLGIVLKTDDDTQVSAVITHVNTDHVLAETG